eukprot:scaffold270426_cov48-Attheya_sp.AAC.1
MPNISQTAGGRSSKRKTGAPVHEGNGAVANNLGPTAAMCTGGGGKELVREGGKTFVRRTIQGKGPRRPPVPLMCVVDGGRGQVKQHWQRFGQCRLVLDSLFLKLQCQGWFGNLLETYRVTKMSFGGQHRLLWQFMRH